jgi:hypothetical protein
MDQARFRFAPGLEMAIVGPHSIVEAFRREYAPMGVVGPGEPRLLVTFSQRSPASSVSWRGGHKSVRWRVGVSSPDRPVIAATIDLAGRPRSFARSLVQGYVVEPLLSVVAAEHDQALVPGAGVMGPGGLILILGRSRAGKSTLMARLAATGHRVLGDDQILVERPGLGSAFPRRLRFYPDIERTAPEAFARMAGRSRLRLRLHGLMATASGGFVKPSLAVDRSAIGSAWVPGPVSIERIVLLERDPQALELRTDAATEQDALAWAARLLDEQRSRLDLDHDAGWRSRSAMVIAREQAVLADAFAGRPVERIGVPTDRPPREAVHAVARHLGFHLQGFD